MNSCEPAPATTLPNVHPCSVKPLTAPWIVPVPVLGGNAITTEVAAGSTSSSSASPRSLRVARKDSRPSGRPSSVNVPSADDFANCMPSPDVAFPNTCAPSTGSPVAVTTRPATLRPAESTTSTRRSASPSTSTLFAMNPCAWTSSFTGSRGTPAISNSPSSAVCAPSMLCSETEMSALAIGSPCSLTTRPVIVRPCVSANVTVAGFSSPTVTSCVSDT